MDSIEIIVNQQYCIIKFKVAKRLNLICSHHKNVVIIISMVEVLVNATVIIMLQSINV